MDDSFSRPVDIYCERLSPDFWAEPVNALSNIAFILATVFAYLLYRRSGLKAPDIAFLIGLSAVVGIGSFIFHTVATSGAMLADIIPIAIFIMVTIYVVFTRIFQLSKLYAIGSILAFLAFNALVLTVFGLKLLNGSIQYLPTFLLLLLIAGFCRRKNYIPAREFFYAAICFLISLIWRSIDSYICPYFPLGTHFLWHSFNGVTMYLVMRGIVRSATHTRL